MTTVMNGALIAMQRPSFAKDAHREWRVTVFGARELPKRPIPNAKAPREGAIRLGYATAEGIRGLVRRR